MATKIKECVCEHGFQDKKYGKNMRVMNQKKGGDKTAKKEWKCTVCGKIQSD